MVIWKKACEFRGDSRVSTWVFAIAYRRRLMALRVESRAQKSRVRMALSDTSGNREASSDQVVTTHWLSQALDRLPLEQRAAIEFAYGLGLSCEEIGTVMRCSVNAVKTRVFHARRKLRVALLEFDLPFCSKTRIGS
jgi:RNA polymerase sigma-70 factor (ECF subfamily)